MNRQLKKNCGLTVDSSNQIAFLVDECSMQYSGSNLLMHIGLVGAICFFLNLSFLVFHFQGEEMKVKTIQEQNRIE